MQKNCPAGIRLMTIGSIMLILFAIIGIPMSGNGISLLICAFGLILGILCRKNKENSDKAKLLLLLAIINIVILIGWRTILALLYFRDIQSSTMPLSVQRLIMLLIIASVVAGTGAYKNMTALNQYNKYYKGD